MNSLDFRIAPINRKPEFAEILACVSPGTYDFFREFVKTHIGVGDYRDLSDRDMEITIREEFNEMRAVHELRAIHDFSNNWFGVPTRAATALLWTWGSIESPRALVEGEEFDPERCEQLLYAQEVVLPRGVTVAQTGGLEWAWGPSLQISPGTGLSLTQNHR